MQLHVNKLAVELYWNMYVLVGSYDREVKVGGCLGIWEKVFPPKLCKLLLIDRKRTC